MSTTPQSWIEKHRPDSLNELQGNNKTLKHVKQWAEGWSPGDDPQLLVGPPGTGKTTTAYIISDILGYPLNQINASAARKTDDIKRMASSMRSSPAGSEHQLVLLDEVDSWHHAADKKPLYKALDDPANPVILTANEKWEIPDGIKRRSNIHEFKLGVRSRKAKLKKIAEVENVDLDSRDLSRLAERPDLRSAINDLQMMAESDVPPGEDQRTWSEGEFAAIKALLTGDDKGWQQSLDVSDDSFRDLGSGILWADENLSKEWSGLEAGVGYDTLSRADRRVRQGYDSGARGMSYAAALLEILPETRLTEPYQGYIKPRFPNWFRSSQRKHDDGTPEGKLFSALKDDRGYSMACSYYEFRTAYLPILRDLSIDERRRLALDQDIPTDALDALDLDPSDFDDWRGEASEGDGWTPDSKSASDW